MLPEDHAPPSLRIAVLVYDFQFRGVSQILDMDLCRRLEAAGHIAFFAEKSLLDLGRDVNRVARYVQSTKAEFVEGETIGPAL